MSDHPLDPCPVCLCPIDHVAVIPNCNHCFCYGCITKWAKSKLNCPLCKTPFEQIQHTPNASQNTHTESLPPPVLPLVDSSLPDLECLTDTYFIGEISRLLVSAERGKREIFLNEGQKHLNDYGYQRLNQVIVRLNELKFMFETEINVDPALKFSPRLILGELYQVEAILQLLWGGRVNELAMLFSDSDQSSQPVRRYGADDYQQIEDDECLDEQTYPSSPPNRGNANANAKAKPNENANNTKTNTISNGTGGTKVGGRPVSRRHGGRQNRKLSEDDYDDEYNNYY